MTWRDAIAVIVMVIILTASTTGTIIGFVQVRRMNRESRDRSKNAP